MAKKLRDIAGEYGLYYAVRHTYGETLQGPVLIIFEPSQISGVASPVVVDTVASVGAAAGRIKWIAKLLDRNGEWYSMKSDDETELCDKRAQLVMDCNRAIVLAKQNNQAA